MLTFKVWDVHNKTVWFRHPLSVSLITEESAPADGLKASFAVSGDVPALRFVEVFSGQERLFCGAVDEQTVLQNKNGTVLMLAARSRAAVLLDNEARPQTYIKPSMNVLMQRHFRPLGFHSFCGTEDTFIGHLTIEKGMSEWAVLNRFCETFLQTSPRLRRDGVIDITGEDPEETVFLSKDRILSLRRTFRYSSLISGILARTYVGGAYSMPLYSNKAQEMGIKRKRYADTAGSRNRSVLSAEKCLQKADAAFEQIIVECSGCLFCETGTTLILSGNRRRYRVKEAVCMYDLSGEKTKITAEVKQE